MRIWAKTAILDFILAGKDLSPFSGSEPTLQALIELIGQTE
jgi:hypothetical protein